MPVGPNRRAFVAGLGSAAAWPVVVRAQQPITPVIGYVSAGFPNTFPNLTFAFQQGLNESGFAETVIVERRYGEGRFDRLPNLVAELARHHVDVIVLGSGPFPDVQSAAQGVPIVSVFGSDPVQSGLVASLNRPAGNVTGVVLFSYSLGAKRLEVLREAVPKAHVIAMLTNAANPDPENKSDAREVEIAARAIGQEIVIVNVNSDLDFDSAFASIARQADALIVMADPVFATRRQQLAALAERHRIPAIYE